jgi:hypothetical protein
VGVAHCRNEKITIGSRAPIVTRSVSQALLLMNSQPSSEFRSARIFVFHIE